MTLTQLEIFALVAELKSFTLAAARLGISQSAISHALKSLETELGVVLLERRQAQAEPTAIGAQLLQRARTMLGLAETMRQEAADARGMKSGTLRIGSFGPTASMRLLPRILAQYRASHPGIEVHVDEGPDRQVVEWLLERRIDVGFVVLPDERFDTYPLVDDQMVALLPPGHALASRTAVTLKDLCRDPFILTAAGSGELVSGLFQAARLAPNICSRNGQLLSTLEAVARGDGVSIVAELALPTVERYRAGFTVHPLLPAVTRKVALAVLDERQASPAALAFIQCATKLRQQQGWMQASG
jgi:DNA-binding transcriptional LysR family regulator